MVFLTFMSTTWVGTLRAQSEPGAAAPTAVAPQPQPQPGQAPADRPEEPAAAQAQIDPQALLSRVAALEAQLAAQRQELDQLREESVAEAEDSELASLISEAQQASAADPMNEQLLRAYGFADVGLQRLWADQELQYFLSESNKTTFVLGNLNVYLDAHPAKDVRLLAEVRFGLMPNGATERNQGALALGNAVDTTVTDPSAANSGFTSLTWAGVVPQRAHIDWTPSDAVNIRTGLFLTPYGIWNVDHGTPTRIMVSEPLFLSAQLIPSRLLGVEVYGTLQALPWTIGYHVHVSNGRTLGQIDFDDTKAIGGRVFISTRFPFAFKLGISGYWGDSEDTPTVASSRQFSLEYDERAVSADLSLDVGSLRIRSEFVSTWTYYQPGKRQVLIGLPLADSVRIGGYIMLAYQLPWYGIEPLLMCEFLRVPVPRVVPIGEGVYMPAVGVNVYFTETTMIRTQFAVAHGFDFSSDPVQPEGLAYQAVSRLITAF